MTPRTQQEHRAYLRGLKRVCESVRPSRPGAERKPPRFRLWGSDRGPKVAMGGWFYGTWRA